MPSVLICALDPLMDDLHGTLLWRDGIERHVAGRFADALAIAVAARPTLVIVDRDLHQAPELVRDLRADASTRATSIAVVARGELTPLELELLEAGANAVLRLPPGPEWDERLSRLLNVPVRRRVRGSVRLEFECRSGRIERTRGTVLDISVTGMRVACSAALEVGADLDFRFRLPGSGAPIAGSGRVVRRDHAGRLGIEFYGLEGDGAQRLARFTEVRNPKA